MKDSNNTPEFEAKHLLPAVDSIEHIEEVARQYFESKYPLMDLTNDEEKCEIDWWDMLEFVQHVLSKPDGYTLLGAGWVSIEEAYPKPQQRVYVVCEIPKFGGGVVCFQTMAEYIPYMTVKEEDYMADEYRGDGDYNEEEDEYYTPEGFYEWQSEPEIHWKISAKVIYWMPLIALP